MEYVAQSIVLLHLLAFATFVGGGLTQLLRREPEISRIMLWGVVAGLLTGLVLMGAEVFRLGYAGPVNWVVLVIKAVLAVGLCVLAISNRRFVAIPRGLMMLLMGLGVLEGALGIWCR